jgi:hypothetical protein
MFSASRRGGIRYVNSVHLTVNVKEGSNNLEVTFRNYYYYYYYYYYTTLQPSAGYGLLVHEVS